MERAADQCLFDSLPFSFYEEYEECSTVRGVWTPRWTPELAVPFPVASANSPTDSERLTTPELVAFSFANGITGTVASARFDVRTVETTRKKSHD